MSCCGGSSDVSALVGKMKSNTITTIDDPRLKANDENVIALAEHLDCTTSLQTLVLRGTFGDAGASAIAKNLAKNRSLRKLVLIGAFSDKSLDSFAKALRKNKTLRQLTLTGKKTGPHQRMGADMSDGARNLCRTLAHSEVLEDLDLSGNWFGSQVAEDANVMLTQRNKIATIKLRGCSLGDEGAFKLYEGLSRNKVLRVLDLGENEIGDKGLEMLVSALARNHTLEELHVDRNKITVAPDNLLDVKSGVKIMVAGNTLQNVNSSIVNDSKGDLNSSAIRSHLKKRYNGPAKRRGSRRGNDSYSASSSSGSESSGSGSGSGSGSSSGSDSGSGSGSASSS